MTQQALADARSTLTAKECETAMLTEQLRRAETRADQLSEEKVAWLQERGALEQRILIAEQQVATAARTHS